jgi:hypothetical protein
MALPPAGQLFVTLAGDKYIKYPIARPADRGLCESNLPPDVIAKARSESGDGEVYCWGAIPGRDNDRNGHLLSPGDYVLFKRKRRYIYVTRVITKHRSSDFAKAGWGAAKMVRPGSSSISSPSHRRRMYRRGTSRSRRRTRVSYV